MKLIWSIIFLYAPLLVLGEEFIVTKYGLNEGLPSTHINCVYQDSKGYLWVGSDAGVCRFDGIVFKCYSVIDGLPANWVDAIAEDPLDGSIFFGTNRGICRLKNDSIELFEVNEMIDRSTIKALLFDQSNQLWIGSHRGMAKWDRSEFQFYNSFGPDSANMAYCFEELKSGEVLIGTNKGITKYTNHQFQGFWQPKHFGYTISILEDRENRIWFNSIHKGINVFENGSFHEVRRFNQKDESIVGEFALARNGNVLLAKAAEISVWKEDKLQPYIADLFPEYTNTILSVYVDRENNFWVSTSDGLYRCRKSPVEIFRCGEEDCLPAAYKLLETHDNKMLIGSVASHVYEVENNELFNVYPDKPTQYGEVSALQEGNDNSLWVGATLGGLLQIKDDIYTQFNKSTGLHSNRIFCDYKDREGNLWFGSKEVLYQYKEGKLIEHGLTNNLFPGSNVLTINGDDRGRIWISTFSKLFCMEEGSITEVSLEGMSDRVYVTKVIQQGNDRIWMSTKGFGIYLYEMDEDNTLHLNRIINTKNGLGSNFILDVIIDENNALWAVAKNGVYRIELVDLENDPQITYYNENDGFASQAWGEAILYLDKLGGLWAGNTSNLFRIQPNKLRKDTITPSTYLTEVRTRNKSIINAINPELNYDDNHITFSYTGIYLADPQKVKYRYRLLGLEEGWSEPTTERHVLYSHLPPGDYTFELMASNGQGKWSKSNVSYHFFIAPPFWTTWWFTSILLILSGLILLSVYRYRVKTLIRKQQLKGEVERQLTESRLMAFRAQANPHFVFNSLSSIQHFITNDEKKNALTYLSKFARLLRQILENSKQSQVSLEEELLVLETYIQMEQLRFDNKFDYKIEVGENLNPSLIEIPGMMIQPYVENAIQHGLLFKKEPGRLTIKINSEPGYLKCTVTDDGIGRKASAEIKAKRSANHRSLGMQIVKERLALLNKESKYKTLVSITDLYDENDNATGTIVEIRIPIDQSE